MNIKIDGLPKLPEAEYAIFFSRISKAIDDLEERSFLKSPMSSPIIVKDEKDNSKNQQKIVKSKSQEEKEDEPQCSIDAREPFYSFEQLILKDEVKNKIFRAVKLISLEKKVFDEWDLRKIEPFPRSALNFFGPPGTGKTMAAHAVASFLKKKVMLASYAEIESKYHGDGPKNVKALFKKAEEADAILFIDEADSLLSRRLSNVTQGSEQAINSMRSQLLICLEQFHGIVIFSTNFVENYDKAFETRVKNIEFSLPEENERKLIWKQHLPEKLPLEENVNVETLAKEIDDICGRDIKNAVIDASLKAALEETKVSQEMLIVAIQDIKKARITEKKTPKSKPLSKEEKDRIEKKLQKAFAEDDEANSAKITIDSGNSALDEIKN